MHAHDKRHTTYTGSAGPPAGPVARRVFTHARSAVSHSHRLSSSLRSPCGLLTPAIARVARAACPQVIVPIAFDQVYWADQVEHLGLGRSARGLDERAVASVAREVRVPACRLRERAIKRASHSAWWAVQRVLHAPVSVCVRAACARVGVLKARVATSVCVHMRAPALLGPRVGAPTACFTHGGTAAVWPGGCHGVAEETRLCTAAAVRSGGRGRRDHVRSGCCQRDCDSG